MALTEPQAKLADLMSDISEECWCAGWMSGLEFTLWRIINGGERQYGQGGITDEQVAELKQLSELIGGWIYWYDDTDNPEADPSEWGERFISLNDWLVMFSEWEEQTRRLIG